MLVRLSQSLYLSTQSQLSENKTMELLVRQSNGQFGQTHFYPACEMSQTFARLTRNKTLTDETRTELKRVGFTFKVINPTEA